MINLFLKYTSISQGFNYESIMTSNPKTSKHNSSYSSLGLELFWACNITGYAAQIVLTIISRISLIRLLTSPLFFLICFLYKNTSKTELKLLL